MKKVYILSYLFFLSFQIIAQENDIFQNIRGRVEDKETQLPIKGATISITNLKPQKVTKTDEEGKFHFLNIKTGHYVIRAFAFGYEIDELSDVVVEAGSECMINFKLEPINMELEQVIVMPKNSKSKPLNSAAVVSAIQFSVEEASKFSGSINDPARMVSAFPGITSSHDADNQIIVRGNSPKGLVWQVEDIEIPNPNHLSDFGATGGTISMLSSFMMTNSDFISGTFPAEYGNVSSGIFDIHLRNGNDLYNQLNFQANVLGLDLSSEGPLKLGENSSYIFNYRYSTLFLLNRLGIKIVGDAIPDYQDLAFKVNIPSKKIGRLSLWGIGGLSKMTEKLNHLNYDYGYDMGTIGLHHKYWLGKKLFLKTSLAYSGSNNHFEQNQPDSSKIIYKYSIENRHLNFKTQLNYRINYQYNIKAGFDINHNPFTILIDKNDTLISSLKYSLNSNGTMLLYQGFINLNYKIGSKIASNLGLHTMYSNLNKKFYWEPRANIEWSFSHKMSLAGGFSRMHRSEPVAQYYYKTIDSLGNISYPNKKLDFLETDQYSLAYKYNISSNLFFKTEIYYQSLTNLPVKNEVGSHISTINTLSGIVPEPLINKGIGYNRGIEMMLQKFYEHGTYFLVSGTVFESKYKGYDTPWYSTAFDSKYALQLLWGREININNRKAIGFSIRYNYYGGRRYTPIDLEKSIQRGYAAYDEDHIFGAQAEPYSRIDFQFRYSSNHHNWTGEWRLDIQNLTNHQNMFGIHYNNYSQEIEKTYQLGLVPVIGYRISFTRVKPFI